MLPTDLSFLKEEKEGEEEKEEKKSEAPPQAPGVRPVPPEWTQPG
jgi:hypothetical protein